MKRRTLKAHEKALWQKVARTIAPLREPKAPPETAPPALMPPPAPDVPPQAPPPPTAAEPAPPAVAAKPKRPRAPGIGEIDRKTRRKLARGTLTIDGRIDLHGMTQEEASRALFHFIDSSYRQRRRVVLVITGKGQGGDGRGILRRSVPVWLSGRELARCVVSYSPASQSHGGDGALYVRLRSPG
ncbi:Smr/MutS family protein [Acuticoccus kandeliae]|uniref:Smr/MutS family protein n=1 Tax=Acuticoccus kandeliae TaxID=2073160 RepID=UPI000D3EAF26|nr:Smr/MutS family protein [Acuticoccus kandeliae]